MDKSYRELVRLPTFETRYAYLRLGGSVGRATFGFDRYLNQRLYRSREWKSVRRDILLRDEGCDLAISDMLIPDRPIIHHINPITLEDIDEWRDLVFDLDNLITVSHLTHNAIHYGDASLLPELPVERRKGDTTLWTPLTSPKTNRKPANIGRTASSRP